MWRSVTMWLPGREVYRPVWMVVCTSGGLYGQPSGQSDITTSGCVSAPDSKSLNEVLQFRRDVQIFYSITTRNSRESIGLVFSVFRDELAGNDGLNRSYVSGVTRGADPDGGCRYQMMRETGEEPLLEIALSPALDSRYMMLSWKRRVQVTHGCSDDEFSRAKNDAGGR